MPLLVALAALAALAFALALRTRLRRDRLPRSLVVQYAPLPGATAFEDAILAGQDRRAPTAALLDLVVRRRARLLAAGDGDRRASVGVELVEGVQPTAAEAALLNALTGDQGDEGGVRRLRRNRRDLDRALRTLVERGAERMQRHGLLAGYLPYRPLLRVLSFGLALLGAAVALAAVVLGSPLGSTVAAAAAVVAASAGWLTPTGAARRFTPAAHGARLHLDGLRQYLVVAEADRMRTLHSPSGAEVAEGPLAHVHLVERLLPHAVIFGVEKQWLAHLRLLSSDFDDPALSDTLTHSLSALSILSPLDALDLLP